MTDEQGPRLSRIAIHPIKSLDPVEHERCRVIERGALRGDREFAIRDAEGRYVNGKRTAAIHRIRTTFDADLTEVTVQVEGTDGTETFSLAGDRAPLEARIEEFLGYSVTVERDFEGGFPDDTTALGPTVVSTATLREVASWFPNIDVEGMRRRLRANLEIGGVPPFWEDRLYADREHCIAFRIGSIEFEGINPCQRCVVPSRDPDTGEEYEGFRETFLERREATLPAWAEETRFDHYFRLMVNTGVPESEWGREIAVGDEIAILGKRPLASA